MNRRNNQLNRKMTQGSDRLSLRSIRMAKESTGHGTHQGDASQSADKTLLPPSRAVDTTGTGSTRTGVGVVRPSPHVTPVSMGTTCYREPHATSSQLPCAHQLLYSQEPWVGAHPNIQQQKGWVVSCMGHCHGCGGVWAVRLPDVQDAQPLTCVVNPAAAQKMLSKRENRNFECRTSFTCVACGKTAWKSSRQDNLLEVIFKE